VAPYLESDELPELAGLAAVLASEVLIRASEVGEDSSAHGRAVHVERCCFS
jgi:hypothetical protein